MTTGRLTIVKADLQGNAVFSYPGDLVYRDERVLVARCIWMAPKPFAVGAFRMVYGDIFMEHFFASEWFNIFQVHDPGGRLKGWYCNITLPPDITEETVTWRDLALDLLVLPDGEQMVLDEEEFRSLALEKPLRESALQGLATLRRWAEEGQTPFGRAWTRV